MPSPSVFCVIRLPTALSVAPECGAGVLLSSKACTAHAKKPGFYHMMKANSYGICSVGYAHHKDHSKCQDTIEPRSLFQEPPAWGLPEMVGNTKLSINAFVIYLIN